MHRIGRAAALVVVFLGAPTSVPAVQADSVETSRYVFESEHMGTTFRIVAYARDAARVQAAATAVFRRMERLDSLFSDYRPDSEIARLAGSAGSGTFAPVSDDLWTLLLEADTWSRNTNGAFDVTVGPLSRLWRWSARRGELPDPDRLRSAQASVDFRAIAFDPVEPSVRLERPGMALDLGGIAKGYAADVALGLLAARGFEAVLIDAGGDLAVGAAPPGTAGWRIALPEGGFLDLEHAAIATSGDAHRHVIVNDTRYAHVVDPRTGVGVIDAATVTVVAPTATAADALASALTVMDGPSGRTLVGSFGNVWVRVTGMDPWTAGGHPSVAPDETPRRPPSRRERS